MNQNQSLENLLYGSNSGDLPTITEKPRQYLSASTDDADSPLFELVPKSPASTVYSDWDETEFEGWLTAKKHRYFLLAPHLLTSV